MIDFLLSVLHPEIIKQLRPEYALPSFKREIWLAEL